jgi:hypothetical protein
MSTEQIILTVATVVLIPALIAEVRYRTRCAQRFSEIESFITFLKVYLLKNAVLEFHSPDPRHRRTDKIIERLVEGEELAADEIDALVQRIQSEAHSAEDKKRRLQATTTLALMDEFIDAVRLPPSVFTDYE